MASYFSTLTRLTPAQRERTLTFAQLAPPTRTAFVWVFTLRLYGWYAVAGIIAVVYQLLLAQWASNAAPGVTSDALLTSGIVLASFTLLMAPVVIMKASFGPYLLVVDPHPLVDEGTARIQIAWHFIWITALSALWLYVSAFASYTVLQMHWLMPYPTLVPASVLFGALLALPVHFKMLNWGLGHPTLRFAFGGH